VLLRAGYEVVMQMSCRDRNRIALQGDLLGAAALGVQNVLCLTGDAGLAMMLGELGTLAEAGGPVVVVVFKDDALDLIRSHQHRAGLPTFGTEFTGPDFVRIAEAHGIQGLRAEGPEAAAIAAESALRSGKPLLIEAAIDPAAYPTTPAARAYPSGRA
jgi:acetolactate synthase-1/2/3 large subunit